MKTLRWTTYPLLLGALVLLGACAVTPDPLTRDEIRARVEADRAALAVYRQPVQGPMTLTDAIARALVSNLDLRTDDLTRLMEQDSMTLAQLGLLPDMSGTINSTHRNRASGSLGDAPEDKPNTSRRVRVLQTQWSVLNFGIGYLSARQAANESLAAEERRRRAAAALINDVTYYFYRTLFSEQRMERLDVLDQRLDDLLDLSERLRESRLEDPLTILNIQAGLYQLKRRISGLRRDLEVSQEKLARLLNLPSDQPLPLIGLPDDRMVRLALGMDLDRAVDEALMRRPELRDFDYQIRNAHLDVWKTYLGLLPDLSLTYGLNTDTSSTAAVRTWTETGARGVMQLLGLITFPWKNERAANNEELLKLRRVALSLAVMEQVRTSRTILQQITRDVSLSDRIVATNDGIVDLWDLRLPFNVTDELVRFRAEVDGILTHIERDDLLAEQQRSLGDMLMALGLPLAPEVLDVTDPAAVRTQVEEHLRGLPQRLQDLARPQERQEEVSAVPAGATP
ncbi:TolC family protein [Novispirillum itersonii]|uniref:TolC family protein n=1 Tax=Novispirillum itersonii TaxID=189 RepID=UPI000363F1AF|nr:TolC family protein [Novispirillum itersonii]